MSILKTIYLQHLNGANVNMTLDSSGNIGVGNTSPQYRLDVTDNTTGQQIRVSSSHGNGTSTGFVSSSTNGRTWRVGSNYVDGLGEFAIYDATSSANRLNINSSGYVTMPNQPAFFAYPNTNTTLGTTTSPYIFAVTTFNRGSNYSTSTGRFTAPVAGAYHFSYGVQHNANFNDNLVVDLRVNGGQYGGVVRAEWTTGALFNMVTASATIYLNVNDYVTIDSIGGTGWGDDAWFSGHLIG